METHMHAPHLPHKAHTTPKDFFLWLAAIITLYGAITSFFTLIFQYVDYAFPDPLAYWSDPYSSSVRVAMATIIVLTPTFLGILLTIRRDIVREPGKAEIWVRRWALMLTIFLAGATAAIDLITLITTFLGGEISIRFALKASVVLLMSVLVMLHFLADLKGYWTLHRRKVNIVGAACGALAVMTVIGGFFIIGSPSHIRELRYDEQKVSDLQNIQYQVTNYYQQKRALPPTIDALNDPLQGYSVPTVPGTETSYEYSVTGPLSFSLCSTFSQPTPDTQGRGAYPMDASAGIDQNFNHAAGHVCFARTVDPEKYPAMSKPL